MFRTCAVLIATIALLAVPSTASAKWIRLSSEHFVFVADAPERDVRSIAQNLEQLRQVVGGVFADASAPAPVPTIVIVFQNDRSFTPFKPVFQGKPVAVAGYFAGAEDVNYIAVNAEQDAGAFTVIFHEYVHALVGDGVGVVPVWVSEGLAQLYETFQSTNGGKAVLLGTPPDSALRLLQSMPTLIPIRELIAVRHDSALYNESDRRTLFYAESWALVHYLTFGGPARTGQLKKYLVAIGQGTAEQAAFDRAFGADPEALERDLQQYVRTLTPKALRVDLTEKIGTAGTAPAELLTDVEASGYLGDMLARLDRPDDARAFLRKTIAADTNAARASSALGLLELRSGNDSAAFPLLERAASLAPGDAGIQSAYGRALTRRADLGRADEDELYARARVVLARALELEPDNASAVVTLAEVEMGSGADPSRAVTLMRRAVGAAPGREEYRLMLAQALAMAGDIGGATDLLTVLAERGSRPAVRDAAARTLTRIDEALRDKLGTPTNR